MPDQAGTKLPNMATDAGDRARYFPAIEKRYGQPVEHWWDLLGELDSERYPDQMALLQEGHGFSRSHANAVVMSFRGSASAKRFPTVEDYFASLTPAQRTLITGIIDILQTRFPHLELVIAWNQPILRVNRGYVFGLSASRARVSVNPFSKDVLDAVTPDWEGFDVLGHTIRIPLDGVPAPELLADMITRRLAELGDAVASD